MFWIYERLADLIVYNLLNLQQGERLAEALHFFIYDTLKIFTLLFLVIFFMSLVRSYFPLERTRRIISRHKKLALPLSAFLGVLTPFCSCSAVPMFIGFVEAGIPLEATFTFLVASPTVNEMALGLLLSLFGLKVALLYIGLGIAVAVFSGYLIGKANPRSLIEDYVFQVQMGESEVKDISFKERLKLSLESVREIVGKVWIYILIAIGIGSFIHGYVPQDLIEKVAKASGIFGVPLAVVMGIPLYSNAAGVLPVIQPLIDKGVPIGTALAFMMSVTALSLPEFLILKQIMKVKLIAIFAGVVGTSIIVAGYIFNLVL
ncbi:hypothetical protein BCF55_0450 [Hydrogenivirga caldilitoris]|uniref:Permease n=1 Tax=Hydrogenivirga caldilitoris TaxID=246264 RepID=A0A497XPK6_9AQUI|nr:permease [Hydrogenivirga caldilitoris]RLJ70184.1 hypothetical protein BCF55_0450 [Hydrogenivirga caldilitoris]